MLVAALRPNNCCRSIQASPAVAGSSNLYCPVLRVRSTLRQLVYRRVRVTAELCALPRMKSGIERGACRSIDEMGQRLWLWNPHSVYRAGRDAQTYASPLRLEVVGLTVRRLTQLHKRPSKRCPDRYCKRRYVDHPTSTCIASDTYPCACILRVAGSAQLCTSVPRGWLLQQAVGSRVVITTHSLLTADI